MKRVSQIVTKALLKKGNADFCTGAGASGEGISFLKMVESYFDKAGKHTNIRPDKLNFFKKPDNVVKFTLTLVRGT